MDEGMIMDLIGGTIVTVGAALIAAGLNKKAFSKDWWFMYIGILLLSSVWR